MPPEIKITPERFSGSVEKQEGELTRLCREVSASVLAGQDFPASLHGVHDRLRQIRGLLSQEEGSEPGPDHLLSLRGSARLLSWLQEDPGRRSRVRAACAAALPEPEGTPFPNFTRRAVSGWLLALGALLGEEPWPETRQLTETAGVLQAACGAEPWQVTAWVRDTPAQKRAFLKAAKREASSREPNLFEADAILAVLVCGNAAALREVEGPEDMVSWIRAAAPMMPPDWPARASGLTQAWAATWNREVGRSLPGKRQPGAAKTLRRVFQLEALQLLISLSGSAQSEQERLHLEPLCSALEGVINRVCRAVDAEIDRSTAQDSAEAAGGHQ